MENYTPSTKAWVKLPLELLKRNGISRQAAVLLAVIIDECKHKSDLSAPIRADTLTAKSSMSRRTVFRTLAELRELGLIEVQRTGRTSIYTLTQGCVELCPNAVQDEQPKQQQPTPRARARKQHKAPTEDELRKMKEYTALANRFLDSDPDEPIQGQQEFPVDDPKQEIPQQPKPTVSDNVQEWLNEHGISTLL